MILFRIILLKKRGRGASEYPSILESSPGRTVRLLPIAFNVSFAIPLGFAESPIFIFALEPNPE